MAISLSLNSLPWRAQLGAFTGLGRDRHRRVLVHVRRPDAHRHRCAPVVAEEDSGGDFPRAEDRAPAAGVPQGRRGAGEPAARASHAAARGAGRRRPAAPRSGHGHRVQPDDPRLHAAAGDAKGPARRVADRSAGGGHLPRSGRVPGSGQQVPPNHQRRQHQDRVAREPDLQRDRHRGLHRDRLRAGEPCRRQRGREGQAQGQGQAQAKAAKA